jgi:hypothetical protein
MEKNNKASEKNTKLKRKIFLSSLSNINSPINSNINNLILKNGNKLHPKIYYKIPIKTKAKIFSSNTKNFKNIQYSLSCINNLKRNTYSPKINISNKHKIDIGIQNCENLSPKYNIEFLKEIIDDSKNKNFDSIDIDYVLESPFRGVEKIGLTTPKNLHKNNYHPIFINNNYKGYFCLKNFHRSKSNISNDEKYLKKNNNDKYNDLIKNKKNIEVNNPLKRLSKMSGVSCTKLRKVIDYSLSNRMDNFRSLFKEKFMMNNIDNKNKNSKYLLISLKSKKNKKIEEIKKDSNNFDHIVSYENIIGSNYFNDKINRTKNYSKLRSNTPMPTISKGENIKLFKNIEIKGKIKSFY